MAKKKGQNYLHGAAILTVGVIVMKILGFFYKIPLGNILGDEGYSMFMGAYNIYYIFFTLATAGLPVALSRMVAEADANGRARQEEKIFRVALVTFTVIGLAFFAIMFCFPHWLAAVYLENPDAAPSVRAMAPAILLVCMVSAYRGYCQGNGNMVPTTVDEVLEVLFKVISGLILAVVVMGRYRGTPMALPMGSAGAIFGVSIGSTVSLLYMVFYKRRHYAALAAPYTAGVVDPNDTPDDDDTVDTAGKIVHDILTIGIPIAAGACILALLNSVDSKLCMNRLQSAAHFTYREAKVLYGVYGKAQTLFNLPAAFITPLTIAIVPAISGAIARKDRQGAGKISEDSMRVAAAVSIPMGVGLAVLAGPIMRLLYPGSHLA
ncbi:MAG: polysaccharide biosynthesis protein, partial [Oscillospiraceae bacterium]|nr:polysaccharide biosynthesis protein [Oscillospiraceae bacterium]